jgi:hypothetical protein
MNAEEALAQICASGKRFYIYVLKRPCGDPFYIGVGTGRRFLDHFHYAARKHLRSHKLSIIRKIKADGKSVVFDIECHSDDRALVEQRERNLIALIGRSDLGLGPLTNNTDGGEGAHNPSPQELERRSNRLKDWWKTRPDRATFLAKMHSPENRAAQAARMRARKGMKRNPPRSVRKWTKEEKAIQAARLRDDPVSKRPGIGAKISAAKLGIASPNHWTKDPLKIAAFARGKHPRARRIAVEGIEFQCIEDAADYFELSRSAICNWLNRGQRQARFIDTKPIGTLS